MNLYQKIFFLIGLTLISAFGIILILIVIFGGTFKISLNIKFHTLTDLIKKIKNIRNGK